MSYPEWTPIEETVRLTNELRRKTTRLQVARDGLENIKRLAIGDNPDEYVDDILAFAEETLRLIRE